MTKKKRRIKYLKSLDEVPEFTNREEEAEFWDTHSLAKIWDQLEPVELKIGGALKAKLEARRRAREKAKLDWSPISSERLRRSLGARG